MPSERTPLISPPLDQPSPAPQPPRPQRTVTFGPIATTGSSNASSTSYRPATQPSPIGATGSGNPPILSALNSKLRRRNSQGVPQPVLKSPAPKIGPQRTTKVSQKLKLLPNPDPGEDGPDEESGREVYSQFTRIKDPTARRDAARLGKADRERLPRVTAYCTANSYKLDAMMKYLKSRAKERGSNPKRLDECIYSPYSYTKKHLDNGSVFDNGKQPQQHERRYSDSALERDENGKMRREEILSNAGNDLTRERTEDAIYTDEQNTPDFDTEVHISEIFLFGYGTVVLWGMSIIEEHRFLKEISRFETEKLPETDVQTEDFNFYYTRDYQARIYNDFISLREKRNYMTKLAISHALAQSVKTSLYEDLVDNTIEATKDIPEQMALEGKVSLSLHQTNVKIGELFILRVNMHLQGTVLDSPQLLWAEPQLEPVYAAMRGYLEIDQRATVLTERLGVIAELLGLLRDLNTHLHDEYLEWIVIVLIAVEIIVSAINIAVDLWAGLED